MVGNMPSKKAPALVESLMPALQDNPSDAEIMSTYVERFTDSVAPRQGLCLYYLDDKGKIVQHKFKVVDDLVVQIMTAKGELNAKGDAQKKSAIYKAHLCGVTRHVLLRETQTYLNYTIRYGDELRPDLSRGSAKALVARGGVAAALPPAQETVELKSQAKAPKSKVVKTAQRPVTKAKAAANPPAATMGGEAAKKASANAAAAKPAAPKSAAEIEPAAANPPAATMGGEAAQKASAKAAAAKPAAAKSAAEIEPVKKKRGRPRKIDVASQSLSDAVRQIENVTANKPKRNEGAFGVHTLEKYLPSRNNKRNVDKSDEESPKKASRNSSEGRGASQAPAAAAAAVAAAAEAPAPGSKASAKKRVSYDPSTTGGEGRKSKGNNTPLSEDTKVAALALMEQSRMLQKAASDQIANNEMGAAEATLTASKALQQKAEEMTSGSLHPLEAAAATARATPKAPSSSSSSSSSSSGKGAPRSSGVASSKLPMPPPPGPPPRQPLPPAPAAAAPQSRSMALLQALLRSKEAGKLLRGCDRSGMAIPR